MNGTGYEGDNNVNVHVKRMVDGMTGAKKYDARGNELSTNSASYLETWMKLRKVGLELILMLKPRTLSFAP